MRRKIKVILSLVIVFTIIFTMGTITIAEVVEVSKSESESPKAEAPKDEAKDEPKEAPKEVPKEDPTEPTKPTEPAVPELPKEEPVLPEVPLIPEEEIEEIVLPEPILVVNSLSMNAEVIPEKEKFINGEDLTYKIKISNDGDLDLYNITVADDLGLEDTISILSPGEEIVMNGSYPIDVYNELEKIGNSIDISAKSDGENLSMNLSFIADIEIPKGSITILNSVDKALDRDTEFDIFIEGPNDTEYTLSLKAGDSATLENLWIGDYTIYSIVPMNYSSRERYTSISLSLNNLNENAKIHHRLDNENWFYDFDHNESNLFSVKSSDIDQVDIETLSLNDMKEKRYDSIYIEIETWEMPEEPIYIMSKTPIISDILDKADKPIKPEKPVEPNKPIEPVKPVIPDKPVEAVKPVGADKPKEPDDRARQMVE